MVDGTDGQLYTIEGFAAALIMVITAWIVLGTTSIYTPGDTHISDMQLEQLGTDVLMVMDTPENATYGCTTADCSMGMNVPAAKSPLQTFIENADGNGPVLFNSMFLSYANSMTDAEKKDAIQYSASVSYRINTDKGCVGSECFFKNQTHSYPFSGSRTLIPGDHAVRVAHWVLLDRAPVPPSLPVTEPAPDNRPQAVLLEVLVWRG